MKKVQVRNVLIGQGVPKICVPIVAKTKKEIIEEALSFANIHVDIVEWRADWFDDAEDIEKVKDVLWELGPALKGVPLLFTFRTSKEGGEKAIDSKAYAALNKAVAVTRLVDLIDVEAFIGDEIVKDIVECAHSVGVKVVASYHDFISTPTKDDMIYRLRKMQDLDGDILKIAVMPKCKMDVLELLEAAVIMSESYADRPIAAISMSSLGVISRLTGEIFGSALTFAASKKVSAPGQIEVEDLYEIMQLLHKSTN